MTGSEARRSGAPGRIGRRAIGRVAVSVALAVVTLTTVLVPTVSAAAPDSEPFSVRTIWDGPFNVNFGQYQTLSCRYFVIAEFDESLAVTLDTPSGPRPFVRVVGRNMTTPGLVPAYRTIGGMSYQEGYAFPSGSQIDTHQLPDIVASPGKLMHVWHSAQLTDETLNDWAPGENRCLRQQGLYNSGTPTTDAETYLGIYPTGLGVRLGVPEDVVDVGSELPVTLEVSNNSGAAVTEATLIDQSGLTFDAEQFELVSGPEPQLAATIEPGASTTLSYTLRAIAPGTHTLVGGARGTLSGTPIESRSTQTIEVAEGLVGTFFNTSLTMGEVLRQGEPAEIRLRLENRSTADLENVRVESVAVVSTDDEQAAATIVPSGRPDARTLTGWLSTVAPGHQDFQDYTLTPSEPGAAAVVAAVSATAPDGARVTAEVTWAIQIVARPLLVELTSRAVGSEAPGVAGAPLEFLLNENEHENRFQVEVEVTNRGDQTIESLHFLDPAAPIDFDTLRVDAGGVPIPGVAITPVDETPPTLPVDELEPGESTSITMTFEGLDVAHAQMSSILQGRMGDDAISGRGVAEVKVLSDVLVEFGMRDSRGGDYQGGQSIRLEGIVENVSEDTTVGVVVFPETDGNAGNGNVFPVGSGGATPTTPTGLVLQPGEAVDLQALLTTLELETASDAEVTWDVRAWRHDIDPETGEIVKTSVPETQIEIRDTDGLSDAVSVRVPPTARPDDAQGPCGFSYFTCGLVTGVENFAVGSYDLVRLAGNTLYDSTNHMLRLIAWTAQMLGEVVDALRGDPAARQALITEVVVDLQALVDTGAITAEQLGDARSAVATALDEFIRRWDSIYRTGDLRQLQTEIGRMAGESPDLLLGGAAFSRRFGRKLLAEVRNPVGLAQRTVRAKGAERAGTMARRLDDAEAAARAGGPPVPASGVFDAGDRLTRHMQADYWTADPRDIETLEFIANAEQVSITYGSRTTQHLDLIRTGRAWPTPRALSIQPVDDIDIDFLGYPGDRKGFADLATPPADMPLANGGVLNFISNLGDCCIHPGRDVVDSSARLWVAREYPDLDPALAERVVSRIHTRVDEFVVNYERFVDMAQTSPGSYDVPVGTVSPLKWLAGGRDAWPQVLDERSIRLRPLENATFSKPDGAGQYVPWSSENYIEDSLASTKPYRRYWEIEFDPLANGDFRPTTGGIELLSVQNLDGTPIVSEAKRSRIYEHLRASIDMSNSELEDFVRGGQSEQLRAFADGKEAAVTVGPGGAAHATYFRESGSIRPGGPNAALRVLHDDTDFLLLAGLPAALRATLTDPSSSDAGTLIDRLVSFFSLPNLFNPDRFPDVVDDLDPDEVGDDFDRDGDNLRPDGDGGLEVHDPDGAPGSDGAPGTEGRSVGQAAGGGAWRPITVADALALGDDPAVLEVSPMTTLQVGSTGDTTIAVSEPDDLGLPAGTDWFGPGDRIIINPGGANEERAVVAELGSLVLTEPLELAHQPGEMIIRDMPITTPSQGEPPGPTPTVPTPTTTPTTPTTPTTTPPVPGDPGAAPVTPGVPGAADADGSGPGAQALGSAADQSGAEGAGRRTGSGLALTGWSPLAWLALAFVLLVSGGTATGVRRRLGARRASG